MIIHPATNLRLNIGHFMEQLRHNDVMMYDINLWVSYLSYYQGMVNIIDFALDNKDFFIINNLIVYLTSLKF